jgi:hypothetical protein
MPLSSQGVGPQAARKSTRCVAALALLLVGVLLGCGTTRVTSVEPRNYGRRSPGKWIVVGIAQDDTTRMRFERVFARRMRERGVDATAAVDLLGLKPIDRELVAPLVAEGKVDTALVTSVVSQERERDVANNPGGVGFDTRTDFYHDYRRTWDTARASSYAMERDVLRLSTRVYELESGRQSWKLDSKTFAPDDIDRVIDEVTKTALKQLAKDGLIP